MGIRIRSAFIVQHANRAQAAHHPNPCYPTQLTSNDNMHRNPNEMLRPCPPKSSNPILIQTYVDNVVLTNTSHRTDRMIIYNHRNQSSSTGAFIRWGKHTSAITEFTASRDITYKPRGPRLSRRDMLTESGGSASLFNSDIPKSPAAVHSIYRNKIRCPAHEYSRNNSTNETVRFSDREDVKELSSLEESSDESSPGPEGQDIQFTCN